MNNKVLKNLLKAIIIFILFELIINTLGALLAQNLWDSINYGKYTSSFISELVVLTIALIILKARNKWYIFKDQKINFIDSLKKCAPILIISICMFLINITNITTPDLNKANLISLIFYVISIGLFEEILFRGIIENELLENLTSENKQIIWAIVLSGIIFGSVHITNIFMGQDLLTTIMQFIQSTSIGILFATVYYLTKNIWALIFLHSFYDFSLLLNEVNLVTECSYLDNVPISLTIQSIIVSIILSLIYIIYSIKIYKSNNSKIYTTIIYTLITIYFIISVLFSFLIKDSDKYYVCPSYEEKSIKLIETHYYNYNNFTYTSEDTILHISIKNNKLHIKDIINNKDISNNIENVKRITLVDDNLMVITINKTKYKLYYIKLNDINNYITFDIPTISGLGYLIDCETNIKYPMIKSNTKDLFIIDGTKLKKVKESNI